MKANAEQLLPQFAIHNLRGRIMMFPLVRMIALILLIVLAITGINSLFMFLTSDLSGSTYKILKYLLHITNTLVIYFIYSAFIRYTEKRRLYELSGTSAISETFTGIFIGASLIGITVIILALSGFYRITDFNSAIAIPDGFFRFGFGAFFEELLFRLIIFKLIEEFVGSWISLLISSALFGFAHMFNENATIWSAVAITIEAGVLLAAAFMLTRRIWLALGLHFGWNFMQASVLGITTSGISFNGLVETEITGPVWITGGDFGVEASVITVVLGLVIAIYLLKNALDDGQLVLPMWKRVHKPTIIY